MSRTYPKRPKHHARFSPITRFMLVIAAAAIVTTGITFAALQSQQAVLKGNTIQTAIANLQISSDGTTYSNSLNGYSFGNLIPGGQPTPTNGYPVYLKNAGTTPLALKLSVDSTIANPDMADLSKVHVILSPLGGGAPQNISLQDLVAASTTGGVALAQDSRVIPSQSTGFTLQVSLDSDAINGPSASIGGVDFDFGAVAVN